MGRRYTDAEKAAAVRLVVDSGRTSAAVARELGMSARSLSAWVRADWVVRRGRGWTEHVKPHFDFLTGYGFTLTDVDASSWWEVEVIYRSPTSAVAVTQSVEFQRVDLHLMRLVDGELPAYPIFVVDSVPVNTFHGDWLLGLRADPEEIPAPVGLSEPEIETQLAFWARALREYAADFLAGDLAVLDRLERVIRDSARRHEQVVTVSLPDSASDQEEADAAARVASAIPDGVAIRTQRYTSRRRA